MAIPTTQKECTTRRIASLIIGLWDKVKNAFLLKTSRGSANGVASLDANGKVPSSQLPTVPSGNLPANSSSSAGIVASGSGQNKKVWMTDSSGNPSWRTVGEVDINGIMRPEGINSDKTYYVEFLRINTNHPQPTSPGCEMTITCRAGNTGMLRLYAQFGDYLDASTRVRIIRLMNKNNNDFTLKFYRTPVTDGFVKFYLKTSANQFIHWWMDHNPQPNDFFIQNNLSTTAPSGELIELPIDGEQVYANGQVGSANTPVYANGNGKLIACTNVPVIEHVTTIPVNPTVGTIYAL